MNGTVSVSDFEVGDRVIDTAPKNGQSSAMRVADIPGTTAKDHYIPATGSTVAEENPDEPEDAPVIGVKFESGGAIYHYPASRLEPVSEDWEAPDGADKTSGRREREQVFGDHSEAVEAFIQDARRAFTEPAVVGEELLDLLTVGPPASETVLHAESAMIDVATPGANRVDPKPKGSGPETRGECQYSRDDSYRPDDDDAICCWECSNRPHNRPEKFSRDDPAGTQCHQHGREPWKLRNAVIKSVDLSGLPENVREAYEGNQRGLLYDIAALRSDDEDDIRRTALSVAYRPHLGDVEEYNYHRALALLRDHGVAQELPIIGDGSYENGGGGQ